MPKGRERGTGGSQGVEVAQGGATPRLHPIGGPWPPLSVTARRSKSNHLTHAPHAPRPKSAREQSAQNRLDRRGAGDLALSGFGLDSTLREAFDHLAIELGQVLGHT